jgi:mannose-1-phosphate guanylyltransferase
MYEKSKENHGNLANGAFYILTQELIASLSTEQDFSNEVIPKYFGKVLVVETNETYLDIGSPESYALAQTISKQHKL